MALSSADIQALNAVLAHLSAHPEDIHLPGLESLRNFLVHHGGRVPVATATKPHASPKKAASEADSEPDADRWSTDAVDGSFHVAPAAGAPSDADEEKAMEVKAAAQELAGDGKLDEALVKLTEALRLTPGKAMYWALRADYFLKAKKPNAAIADATRALEINNENARALRVRGTALRHLGRWEESAHDLNEAQVVDYDESIDALLKVVQPKSNAKRDARRRREIEEQEARQEQLRQQRQKELAEEAAERARQEEQASGMPGGFPGGMPGGMPGGFPGGMPGGMPGGFPGGMPGGMPGAGGMPGVPPGMEQLFSDPEIVAAMQDPEVAPKLAALMSNPAAAMQMMGDPKMGPLIQKIMSKMMGGGMPGGMGGMPGMGGGMPGGRGGMPGGRGGMGGMPRGGGGGAAPQRGGAQDDLD